ncbi:hypothetical protein J6590_071983 [Homalodisca vitripennis]|nr:hypothetical protein J6590_071983 [Homalodisca vitripennis]
MRWPRNASVAALATIRAIFSHQFIPRRAVSWLQARGTQGRPAFFQPRRRGGGGGGPFLAKWRTLQGKRIIEGWNLSPLRNFTPFNDLKRFAGWMGTERTFCLMNDHCTVHKFVVLNLPPFRYPQCFQAGFCDVLVCFMSRVLYVIVCFMGRGLRCSRVLYGQGFMTFSCALWAGFCDVLDLVMFSCALWAGICDVLMSFMGRGFLMFSCVLWAGFSDVPMCFMGRDARTNQILLHVHGEDFPRRSELNTELTTCRATRSEDKGRLEGRGPRRKGWVGGRGQSDIVLRSTQQSAAPLQHKARNEWAVIMDAIDSVQSTSLPTASRQALSLESVSE